MICREGIRLRCFSLWIDFGFWEKRVNRKRLSDFFRTFLRFMRNMHFGAYFRYHVLYWPTPHRRVSCIWLWCGSVFLVSGPFHCLTRFSWRWTCLVRRSLFLSENWSIKLIKKLIYFFWKFHVFKLSALWVKIIYRQSSLVEFFTSYGAGDMVFSFLELTAARVNSFSIPRLILPFTRRSCTLLAIGGLKWHIWLPKW